MSSKLRRACPNRTVIQTDSFIAQVPDLYLILDSIQGDVLYLNTASINHGNQIN